MIIDCLSDLHGFYPKLEGGDLLIVAGDLTARDETAQYFEFFHWIAKAKYKKKIVIAGNHDNFLEKDDELVKSIADFEYLCDSGTEFEGLKICGSPWTAYFEGMNPNCTAFTINVGCDTDDWLAEKWLTCPLDTDIIICHGPPYGILDQNREGDHCGSPSLRNLMFKVKPSLMIWGHIHEQGGKSIDLTTTFCVNASYVNERYEPKNKAIRIEFNPTNKRSLRLN